MQSNCKIACGPLVNVNLVIKLRRGLFQLHHLNKIIFEYFKLAEIGCCLVFGSVEDEKCFFTLKFLKSCHRNKLEKHLPLAVRMFRHRYFFIDDFPYKEAIQSWKSDVKVVGTLDFINILYSVSEYHGQSL